MSDHNSNPMSSQSAPNQLPNASKKKPKKKKKSSQAQPQPQPQSQPQPQTLDQLSQPRQRPIEPGKGKRDERSKKQPNPFKGIKPPQRSKSSSPEKMRRVLRQPHLRLPAPQQHNIDGSTQKSKPNNSGDGNVASAEIVRHLRFRNRAGEAPNEHSNENEHDTGNVFEVQNFEIERRKAGFRDPSSRLRALTLNLNLNQGLCPPTRNPISYATIRTGSSLDVVPPRLVRPIQRQNTISPKHSPVKEEFDISDLSPTDTSSGSDCDWYSCTFETSPVPTFTKLFRPRYPPDNPAEFFNGPVPRVFSYEHGIAVREELTKFHASVYLVDEEAGEDAQMRMDGLRKVVDESMPMLRWLGLEPQNIVFFYHGRGETSMGFDVWEAMSLWGKRQRELRYQDALAYHARKAGDGTSMARSCTQDVSGPQQEEERSKQPYKQMVADNEELSRNKKGTKKWMDFAEYQKLNGLDS